jgi:hypothetical protein
MCLLKKGADLLGKKVEDFASELANKESENDALNALLARERKRAEGRKKKKKNG